MRVKEKRKPRRKVIHPQTCSYCRIDVGDAIAKRKAHFLRRR